MLVDLPQRRLGGYVIPDLTRHLRQMKMSCSVGYRGNMGE